MQTDFGWMLVRLLYSGPLLYLGLAMALDPAGFISALGNLEQGIRRFDQHLQGLRGQPLIGEVRFPPVTPGVRAAFRIAGAALALIALLHLTGVLA